MEKGHNLKFLKWLPNLKILKLGNHNIHSFSLDKFAKICGKKLKLETLEFWYTGTNIKKFKEISKKDYCTIKLYFPNLKFFNKI